MQIQIDDLLKDEVGHGGLVGGAKGHGVVRADPEDFIVFRAEADVGARHVIGHDRIDLLRGQFFTGVLL